jgi:hypothetical protein
MSFGMTDGDVERLTSIVLLIGARSRLTVRLLGFL